MSRDVVAVMAGVDVVIGPLLTLIVARPSKPRRVLARDIAIIATVQLIALVYGATSLWSGRPLYYAFSENVLQMVQAYDIDAQDLDLARRQKRGIAAALVQLAALDLGAAASGSGGARKRSSRPRFNGGSDVIGMPRYYKRWERRAAGAATATEEGGRRCVFLAR